VRAEGDELLQKHLKLLLAHGYSIAEVVPRQESLEDLFVREALG
jgi:hypothetical protein